MEDLVSYDFYRDTYLGDVDDERKFTKLSRKAFDLVNLYTFDRISKVEDELLIRKVKFTICELVDHMAHYEDVGKVGDIKSWTQGKRSESYFSLSDVGGKETVDNDRYMIIYNKLASTGLMYRGIR